MANAKLVEAYESSPYIHPQTESFDKETLAALQRLCITKINGYQTDLQSPSPTFDSYVNLIGYQIVLAEVNQLLNSDENYKGDFVLIIDPIAKNQTIFGAIRYSLSLLEKYLSENRSTISPAEYCEHALWMVRYNNLRSLSDRTLTVADQVATLAFSNILLTRASQLRDEAKKNSSWTTSLEEFYWVVTNTHQFHWQLNTVDLNTDDVLNEMVLPFIQDYFLELITDNGIDLDKEEIKSRLVELNVCGSIAEVADKTNELLTYFLAGEPHRGGLSQRYPNTYYNLKLKKAASHWQIEFEELDNAFKKAVDKDDAFSLTNHLERAEILVKKYRQWWRKLTVALVVTPEDHKNFASTVARYAEDELITQMTEKTYQTYLQKELASKRVTGVMDPANLAEIEQHRIRFLAVDNLIKTGCAAVPKIIGKLKESGNLQQQYYRHLYQTFENLLLTCKQIATGLVSHTHQNTLGKVSSVIQALSGALSFIPVAGPTLSTVVRVASSAAVQIDYQRTVNGLKQLDRLFSSDELKLLSHELAAGVVDYHFDKLSLIIGAVKNTVVDKSKDAVLNQIPSNPFNRVADYYCTRLFLGWLNPNKTLQDILGESHTPVYSAGQTRLNAVQQPLFSLLTGNEKGSVFDSLSNVVFSGHKLVVMHAGGKKEFTLAEHFTTAAVTSPFFSPKGSRKQKKFHPTFNPDDFSYPALCNRLNQQASQITELQSSFDQLVVAVKKVVPDLAVKTLVKK